MGEGICFKCSGIEGVDDDGYMMVIILISRLILIVEDC